jgi:hypothetical protein
MILLENDARLFYKLQFQLLNYVLKSNNEKIIINTMQEYYDLPQDLKLDVRNTLWNNLQWIDKYIMADPDKLLDEEKQIINKWKQRIKGTFLLERILKKYAVFIHDNSVYGVIGLYDEIDELIDKARLPLYVEAVLLPFKNRIVYDGLISEYSVSFGKGIRDIFKDIYNTAKNNNCIITFL